MTLRDIYARYKIMHGLQLHQLRVAAVAKLICDNFDEPLEEREVVLTGLFHDMGNIIKSDLTTFPQFLEPEGLAYWQGVKDEFVRKYGPDEHRANIAIARELELPERVCDYIDHLGFSMLKAIKRSSFGHKIAKYADLRVGPFGILSLDERLSEARERYGRKAKQGSTLSPNDGNFDELAAVAADIEKEIFAHSRIRPEDINDRTAAPVIEELWEYNVS